jgi:hypothetical protein
MPGSVSDLPAHKCMITQKEGTGMTGHVLWRDIRAQQVATAGGEAAIDGAKAELLAEMIGPVHHGAQGSASSSGARRIASAARANLPVLDT